MNQKRGPKPSYTNADIALAYELRGEGVSWKLIAYGLGCQDDAIRKAVQRAERRGIE